MFTPIQISPREAVKPVDAEKSFELFDFELKLLEEKTLQDGLFRSRKEYLEAFTEVKKFLWLCAANDRSYPMMSRGIDELWHQFILFTVEYHNFCDRYFGQYIHHAPAIASIPTPDSKEVVMEFFRAYQENFGPVSRLWLDPQPEENEFQSFADAMALFRLSEIPQHDAQASE